MFRKFANLQRELKGLDCNLELGNTKDGRCSYRVIDSNDMYITSVRPHIQNGEEVVTQPEYEGCISAVKDHAISEIATIDARSDSDVVTGRIVAFRKA